MLGEFQREEALIHYRRGLVLESIHRVDEAVDEYRQAIAHDPHLCEAHGALGAYYLRHGLLAKATEEFRIVARLDDNFDAHFNLGCALLDVGSYDDALESFGRCLQLSPDHAALRYELGVVHFLRGEYAETVEHLLKAQQRMPLNWKIFHLLGRCQLRLGLYDEAHDSLTQALKFADPIAQVRISERIRAVERYREVGTPEHSKGQLYAEYGVAYLGSAQDDGLRLDEFADYHFTYPDIGVTLQRFIALCREFGWRFSSVVGLDRLSKPLTEALALLLDLPQRYAGDVEVGEIPLLVLAIGRESEVLKIAAERIPAGGLTFCLGLNWLRHGDVLPDITGVIARGACGVPWEPELRRLRAGGAKPEQINACVRCATEQIVAAVREAPVEPNSDPQVHYYSRNHPRLRFAPLFDGERNK